MFLWLEDVRERCFQALRAGAKWWGRLSGREAGRRLDQQADVLKWLLEATTTSNDFLGEDCQLDGPLISVVMPVWNRAATVRESIASVMLQTYKNWELLVIDDGSTDETATVLTQFAGDSRVRILTGPHQGVCKARNRALQEARGDIIAYLDSDNTWFPRYLAAVAHAFSDNAATECVYAAQLLDEPTPGQWSLRAITFEREQFLQKGGIDLNVFAHRRELIETFGGFDERLTRLIDWELIIRLTSLRDPVRLPMLGGRYSVCRPDSISARERSAPNRKLIRQWHRHDHRKPLRVLYAVANYPQLTETYIRSEIATMQRWGVHVEVWSEESDPRSPYPAEVPVHHGSLRDAIEFVQPELVHVHWLNKGKKYRDVIRRADLPMTVRGHSFEFGSRTVQKLAKDAGVASIYLFPHFAQKFAEHPKIHPMTSAFNSEFFFPAEKNRRLVVRTGAGKPTKGLESFFEIAQRCPEHQFVLVLGRLPNLDGYVEQLLEKNRQLGSPVMVKINLSNEESASLVREAGIYLHTYGDEEPFGMPISIAESLATGAVTLVRDLPGAAEYLAGAGQLYRSIDEAAAFIQQTLNWSEDDWIAAQSRAVETAQERLSDEVVYRPLFNDWLTLTNRVRATLPFKENGTAPVSEGRPIRTGASSR